MMTRPIKHEDRSSSDDGLAPYDPGPPAMVEDLIQISHRLDTQSDYLIIQIGEADCSAGVLNQIREILRGHGVDADGHHLSRDREKHLRFLICRLDPQLAQVLRFEALYFELPSETTIYLYRRSSADQGSEG